MKVMEEHIFVFKTDIQNAEQAEKLKALNEVQGVTDWNTDLEDCDRILRVVGWDLDAKEISQIIDELGFYHEELARQ